MSCDSAPWAALQRWLPAQADCCACRRHSGQLAALAVTTPAASLARNAPAPHPFRGRCRPAPTASCRAARRADAARPRARARGSPRTVRSEGVPALAGAVRVPQVELPRGAAPSEAVAVAAPGRAQAAPPGGGLAEPAGPGQSVPGPIRHGFARSAPLCRASGRGEAGPGPSRTALITDFERQNSLVDPENWTTG